MTGHPDFDAILRGWMSEGSERAPASPLQQALATTASMPQRRRNTYRFTRASDLADRPSSLRTAFLIAATVTLLLVATLGLAIQFGLIRLDPEPQNVLPFPSSAPQALESPPSDATRFTSQSGLGAIVWDRIETNDAIYPCCEIDGRIYGRGVDGDTWWILDGPAWAPAEPPEFDGAAAYIDAGETQLATVSPDSYSIMMGPASSREVITFDPFNVAEEATIYRRAGATWTPLELPPIAAATGGLRVSDPRFQGGAGLSDGTWVVPVIQFAEVPWGELLGQYEFQSPDGSTAMADPWPIWNRNEERLDVVEPGGYPGSVLASYDVVLTTSTPPAIEFRDIATGETVHSVAATLPGWSPDEMLASLRGYGLRDVSFLVGRGDELSVVRPPWPPGEEFSDSASIVAANDRLYAASLVIGDAYDATAVHLWSSTDGVAWAPVELPQPPGAAFDWIELIDNHDTLLIVGHDDDGGWIWSSADGASWTTSDLGFGTTGYAVPAGFGWIASTWDGRAMAVSSDGTAWEPIEAPALPGEQSVTVQGDYVIFGPALVDDRFVTWLGHLDD